MEAAPTPTPRLLHYMFLSLVPPGAPPRPANLSRAYDYWLRSCVRANPAYKIVLWTRDDCNLESLVVASSEDTTRKLQQLEALNSRLEAKLDRLLKAQGIQDMPNEPHVLEC